jgi:hypothetical protein
VAGTLTGESGGDGAGSGIAGGGDFKNMLDGLKDFLLAFVNQSLWAPDVGVGAGKPRLASI